ncbi:PKD domain-containing protein [Paenibacillus mesotrionivorans]|uniref:PKD domain-containing protein n=1 Tax=Paenibacillus mesotrionivorans TaxID=3160968 RepID=A0ACC7NWC0_9BACL
MKVKRRVKVLAVGTVLGVMLWMILLPLFTGDTAHAQTVSYPINYSGQATVGWQAAYSRHATLDLPLAAEAITGKSISKVELMLDGSPIETYTDMSGQASWSKSVTGYAGTAIEVASSYNSTVKGYYAWYRAPGDTKWQADLILPDGSSEHRTVGGIGELDSYGLPTAPAAEENRLTLGGSRTSGFKINAENPPGNLTKGQEWDFNLVDLNPSFVDIKTKADEKIEGPYGTSGQPDISVQPYSSNWKETFIGDLQNFRIRYKQDFSFEPEGAYYYSTDADKVNVYFAAFETSFVSHTYRYPNEIRVTYVDKPGASATPTPTPTPTPDKEKIVANFDIEEPVIEFGEQNWARPIGSSVTGGGHKLKEYVWTVSQDGHTETIANNAFIAMGGFPPSPRWLTTGTVSVSLKVVSTSGNSASAGPKTFQIISPTNCSSYNPNLDFSVGFVEHGNRGAWEAITSAVVGDYVDVQVMAKRPDAEAPPSGSYPRTFTTWDWKTAAQSSSWLKKYYEGYQPNDDEEYYSFPYNMIFTNADIGSHSIKATRTDVCGNARSSTAQVTVVPPNPVAVIRGPGTVKEARPLTEAFDSSSSYSPVKGRSINHSRDEWGNKQTVYYTPGTEIITLKVWDNGGLPSLEEARHTLTVLPDLPPVALGKAPGKAIRGSSITIKDASYSPDGDTLKPTEIWEQYDANNDGIYDGETLVPLSFNDGKLTRQYDKVGKYRYKIRAVEISPLEKDDTSYFYVEVVNDSPWVSFEMSSFVQEPMVIPTVPVSLNPSDWNATSTFEDNVKKNWKINSDGSMGTYSYVANFKGSWSSQDFMQYGTVDPNASTLLQEKGDLIYSGDSTRQIRPIYLAGRGTIYIYERTYSDWTEPYTEIYIQNLAGQIAKVEGNGKSITFPSGKAGILAGVNTAADEIIFQGGYLWDGFGYRVYRLSSFFSSWQPINLYDAQFQVVPVLLREYAKPVRGSPIEGTRPEMDYDRSTLPTQNKPSYLPLTGADGATVTIPNNSYDYSLSKKNSAGNTVWQVSLAYAENGPYGPQGFRMIPKGLMYNGDETRLFTIGAKARSYSDEDGEQWGFMHNMVEVRDAGTGSLINRVSLSSTDFEYNITNLYAYKNKLIVTGDMGLQIYDQDLQLIYNNPSMKNSKLQGDGLLFSLSNETQSGGNNQTNYGVTYYVIFDINIMQVINQGGGKILPAVYNSDQNDSTTDYISHTYQFTGYYDETSFSHYSWSSVKQVPYRNRPLMAHSQLINSQIPQLSDSVIGFKYRYTDESRLSSNTAGMSFRIKDRRNMLRLQVSTNKLNFVKIVEGNETLLKSEPYSFDKNVYYNLQIRSAGSKHTAYVNGVPLLSIDDGTFASGTFGPYSDLFNVSFKDVTYQDRASSNSSLTKDTVIVDQTIQYALTYEDTESDPHPLELTWWKFIQTNPNKFLDAGDGKSGWSGMNGRTDHGNLPSLDKVGVWRVTHWLKDDPHPQYPYPSEVFGNYRGESNQFGRNIIVHRRPVALFTLWLNGDGTVGWNEQSYDPDRWLSNWNYSTESPVYASNRGIYARKYKYITPSGLEQEGKLTRPTESGVYTVSEAVMDEYGAWSDWYDQQITANIVLPPNKLPVVDFELPSPVYRDDLVQLTNKSYDPDGDPLTYSWSIMKPPYTSHLSTGKDPAFIIRDRGLGKDAVSPNWFITLEATDSKGETGTKTKPLTVLNHVPTTAIHGKQEVLIRQTHSYQSGGADQDSEDNGNLSYYWKVTAPDGTEDSYSGSTISLTFTQGGTYKLEHWVVDPVGDSSNIVQLLVSVDDNKPPVPGFTMAPNPAFRGESVGIVSMASDPDGIIVKHDYWISGPGIDQHWTSEPNWNRTFNTLGSYTIRQRVEDNKGAAAETSQVLQVINRLPTVELTTPSGPDIDNPSVNIPPFRAEWSYADLDGDQQQSWHFRIYEYGSDRLMIQGSDTGTASGFNVAPGVLVGGTTYYAVVTVSDGYDTVSSSPKFFILNRPPVADFDWSPKPVYEGDTVTLTSLSTDPDGDELLEKWEIKAPDGTSLAYDAAHPPKWTQVGNYDVKLTVVDPFGAANSITKSITVLPLSIEGQVHHTTQWNLNRQKSNLDKGDDPESPWLINQFLAGEKFMLMASTTNIQTGSTVQANEVWVTLVDTGDWDHLSFTSGARNEWEGSLYKPEFYHLSEGSVTFLFEVIYSNGTRKQDLVEVEIRTEQTDDYWQLIRDK